MDFRLCSLGSEELVESSQVGLGSSKVGAIVRINGLGADSPVAESVKSQQQGLGS